MTLRRIRLCGDKRDKRKNGYQDKDKDNNSAQTQPFHTSYIGLIESLSLYLYLYFDELVFVNWVVVVLVILSSAIHLTSKR